MVVWWGVEDGKGMEESWERNGWWIVGEGEGEVVLDVDLNGVWGWDVEVVDSVVEELFEEEINWVLEVGRVGEGRDVDRGRGR